MSNTINLQPAEPGCRRRYTVEQRRVPVSEAEKNGESVSAVARRGMICRPTG